MLSAAIKLQHVARNYRDRFFFRKIVDLLSELQQYDQQQLCRALNLKDFDNDLIKIVFKLQGPQFPPCVVFAVKLQAQSKLPVSDIMNPYQTQQDLARSKLKSPQQPKSQLLPSSPPQQSRRNHFMPLTFSRFTSTQLICKQLSDPERKLMQKLLFKFKPQKTAVEKRAEELKIVFGLKKQENDEEFMLASQASDLREFIQMLSSNEIKERIDENVENAFKIEDKFDIDSLMGQLPEGRFE
ncbi:Conserved_hypothetical protein [Hexamita inflata]|uniref:Uncharacterized protein n=1 Tax=Hexamita inflata TaxID=28002 RepID=A0ABP1H682_9EUKA